MTKSFPGAQKPVLSHINLQFYHGAKIGIVGPNGAGKSTLMKIMAGIDKEFTGEAWPGENITVGYLAQEPQLDPSKNVLENVKDGAREVADMVDRFNAISAEMGDPKDDTDFDALMEEMGELQDKIDAVDGWTLDNQLEVAMEALRCPPSRLVGREPLGRREAPHRADPAADPEAVDPAARRADQPPRRRERPVARKPPQGICRRGADDHPRPLFPRQCGRAGSSRSIAGNTSPTRAITRPTSRRRPSASSRRSARNPAARRRSSDELEWIRQGAKARQTKSKARIAKFDQLVAAQEKHVPGQGARSSSRCPSGSAARSSRSRTSPRPMATNCCSRICPSPCRRAASSA